MVKKLSAAAVFFTLLLVIIPYLFAAAVKKDVKIPFSETGSSVEYELAHISAENKAETIKSYITEEDKVCEINLEEYITGVVAAEMPAAFEEEALKAQAVAARSYILSKVNSGQTHENGADVCNNPTHCKAYCTDEALRQKWGADYDKYYAKISKCVSETADCVMVYNGEIINAVFHSTSSGKTESAEDVWGKATPYLVSVASFGDELSPKYHSSLTVTAEEFKNTLKNAYPAISWQEGEALVGEAVRSEAGGIISISIGNIVLSGSELRNIFALRSSNINFDVTNTHVTMNVTGNGHGVGMSQYGANYLASQSKNFIEILKTYYTGVEVVKID